MTLTDLAPRMLDVSRRLNPECEHILGDMRTLRLARRFDAVFVHDAICYMTTHADLRRAVGTAFVHCRPGGVALFCPETRESFKPRTRHGGHDRDGRSLRYLEWDFDPDPNDATFVSEMVYLLREGGGEVRCVHDRHVMGLFSKAAWLATLTEAGFVAEAMPFEHSECEPGSAWVFLGRRANVKRS
jgi:SAM-dependent methyltransferase